MENTRENFALSGETFYQEMMSQYGYFIREEDKALFDHALATVIREKGKNTRVVVFFREQRLGKMAVGSDRGVADSLLNIFSENGKPTHHWEKRKSHIPG